MERVSETLSRRSFLRGLTWAAGASVLAACQPSAPALAPATPAPGATGGIAPTGRVLPLFDTHVHYSDDAWAPVPVERALRLMDEAGTRLALVSSTPDAGTNALHQAAPDR